MWIAWIIYHIAAGIIWITTGLPKEVSNQCCINEAEDNDEVALELSEFPFKLKPVIQVIFMLDEKLEEC